MTAETVNPRVKLSARILDNPWKVLLASVLLIALAAMLLPQLVTDTRPNTFLAPDNPALVYREKVKEQFGLSDPLIIAVVNEGPHGIFNPGTLALVDWLATEVAALPNVDENRLQSLATESNIRGSSDGLEVAPFSTRYRRRRGRRTSFERRLKTFHSTGARW